ncbi:MAG: TonB-dependent receptor, partial [Acidobacteriota bacterium]
QTTLSVIYVGERQDIDPNTFSTVIADSYVVANLAGSVRVGNAVEIFARIDNLFDEEYQEVLGFNAPDRSAFAGVKWSF